MAARKPLSLASQLMQSLNQKGKGQDYFVTEDKESGSLIVRDLRSGTSIVAPAVFSQHENITGAVVVAKSMRGSSDAGKAILPRVNAVRYSQDNEQLGVAQGQIESTLTSSIDRYAAMIKDSFRESKPNLTAQEIYQAKVNSLDPGSPYKPNSGIRLSDPLSSKKTIQSLDVHISDEKGNSLLPMQETDVWNYFEKNIQYPQRDNRPNAVPFDVFNRSGIALDDKKRFIQMGIRSRVNPQTGRMEVESISDPAKQIKYSQLEAGADPVTWYQWQSKNGQQEFAPMQPKTITNENPAGPGLYTGNSLMPTRKQGTVSAVRQVIFDNPVIPGSALYYGTEGSPEMSGAVPGYESQSISSLSGVNLQQLASGEVKFSTAYKENDIVYANARKKLASFTNANEEVEDLMLGEKPADRLLRSASLALPYYYDPKTNKGVMPGTKGAVSTEEIAKQIEKTQGIKVSREMADGKIGFKVGYSVINTTTSVKMAQSGSKFGEVPTGERFNVTQDGVTLPVSHVTAEAKSDLMVHGWFDQLNYNQMQSLVKDWAGTAPNDAQRADRMKLAAYMEKTYKKRSDKGQELRVDIDKMAAQYNKISGGQTDHSGMTLLSSMYTDVIRNENTHPDAGPEAAQRNARNLQTYKAGWVPNQFFSYGMVSKDNFQTMMDDARSAYEGMDASERPASFENYMNEYFYATDRGGNSMQVTQSSFDKPLQVMQKTTRNASYMQFTEHRRVEHEANARGNLEFLFGLNSQYPKLAKSQRLGLDQLPRKTANERGQAALISFSAFQTQARHINHSERMNDDDMPTEYGELTPEKIQQIKTKLDLTKDLPMSEQLEAMAQEMGDKPLQYSKEFNTFLPNAGQIKNTRWEKLGVESNALTYNYLQSFRNLANLTAKDQAGEFNGDRGEAGHEAVSPLYNKVRDLVSTGGEFAKTLYNRSIRTGTGGRYGLGMFLDAGEYMMSEGKARAVAIGSGIQEFGRTVRDIQKGGFQAAFLRYPQLYKDAILSLTGVKERDLVERLGEDRLNEIKSNPLTPPMMVSMAAAKATVGDFDFDPYLMALDAKVQGTKNEDGTFQATHLSRRNDPDLAANRLTNEKARNIQAGIFKQTNLRDAYDAGISSWKDMLSQSDPLGKVLGRRGYYEPKKFWEAGMGKYLSKTLAMGIGYNSRHALRPAMAFGGYSDKEINRVESILPNLYQPALDNTFEGNARRGHTLSAMLASSYLGHSEDKGAYLKLVTGNVYKDKGNDQSKQTGTTINVRDLMQQNMGGLIEFAGQVASTPVPTKNGNMELDAEQYASLFAFPGEGEVEKLAGTLQGMKRDDWSLGVGSYFKEAFGDAPEGETASQKVARTRAGVERIMKTPLIGGIFTNSFRKGAENYDVGTGTGRSFGEVAAMQEIDQLVPGVAKGYLAGAFVGSASKSNKGGIVGLMRTGIAQLAHSLAPEGSAMKSWMSTLLTTLAVKPVTDVKQKVSDFYENQIRNQSVARPSETFSQAQARLEPALASPQIDRIASDTSGFEPPMPEPPPDNFEFQSTAVPAPVQSQTQPPSVISSEVEAINNIPRPVSGGRNEPLMADDHEVLKSSVKVLPRSTSNAPFNAPRVGDLGGGGRGGNTNDTGAPTMPQEPRGNGGSGGRFFGGRPSRPYQDKQMVNDAYAFADPDSKVSIYGSAMKIWSDLEGTMRTIEEKHGYAPSLDNVERVQQAMRLDPNGMFNTLSDRKTEMNRIKSAAGTIAQARGIINDKTGKAVYSKREMDVINNAPREIDVLSNLTNVLGKSLDISAGMMGDMQSFTGSEEFANLQKKISGMGDRELTRESLTAFSREDRATLKKAQTYSKKFEAARGIDFVRDTGLFQVGDIADRAAIVDGNFLNATGKGAPLMGSEKTRGALQYQYAKQTLLGDPSISQRASFDENGKLVDNATKVEKVFAALTERLGELNDVGKERVKGLIEETESLKGGERVRESAKSEHESNKLERQLKVQGAREEVEYQRKQVLAGDSGAVEKLTKAEGVLGSVMAEEKEANEGFIAKAGRQIFGGWGLMYMQSIGGLMTRGLGYGQQQRQASDMGLAGGAYNAYGSRFMPLNQENQLTNAMAVNGASNNPMTALGIYGAKNPMLRDAGNIAFAGLGASAYAGFLGDALKIAPAAMSKIVPAVGVATALGWAGMQAYSSSQDEMGTAYRLSGSSYFQGMQKQTGPSGWANWKQFGNVYQEGIAALAKAPFESASFGDWAYGLTSLFGNEEAKKRIEKSSEFQLYSAIGSIGRKPGQPEMLGLADAVKNAGDFGLTKDEAMYANQKKFEQRFENYSQEAIAQAHMFAYKANMNENDPRLKGIIHDYQFGGWAANTAGQMAQAFGQSASQMYDTANKNNIFEIQAMLANRQNMSEQQKMALESGLNFASSLAGWGVAKGSRMTQVGMERAAMDFGSMDSLQQNTISRNAQQSNMLMEEAAYYGESETGKELYRATFDVKQKDQWKAKRLMNLDPLMLATLGTQGQTTDPVSLKMLDGRSMDAAFLSMTDVGLNGKLTGLGWGQTSFALASAFGNYSAEQMVGKMYGADWQNNKAFDQKMLNAGLQGVQLAAPITMPDGSVLDKVGGMMGMNMYMNQRSAQVQLADIARSEKAMALNEAYTYKSWGLQDKGRELSNAYQEWQFGFQGRQIDMNVANFNENMGMNKRQSLTQRSWTSEDWARDDQTRQLQWGWKVEDFGEESRFLTGRERKKAERQFGRDTIMHNLEEDKVDTQKSRQQELWKMEDDRFNVQKKQFMQSIEMQRESLDRNKQYYEDRKKLEEQEIKFQREHYKQQTALQKEGAKASADWVREQLKLNKTMAQMQLATTMYDGQLRLLEDNLTAAKDALVALLPALEAIAGVSAPGSGSSGGTPPPPAGGPGGGGTRPGGGGGNMPVPNARGGDLRKGVVQTVGENGWEFVIDGRVIPHAQSKAMAAQGVRSGQLTSSVAGIASDNAMNYYPQDKKSSSQPGPIAIYIGDHEIKGFIVKTIEGELS